MNTEQVANVQRSFELAEPMADEIADGFYTRLFELDPTLRPLFHIDMKEQGRKLMTMLAMIVRGLDRPETIIGPAQRLGERHVEYGVQPEHYATVGEALLSSLGQSLGPAYTEEVEEAWTAAYTMLADVMMEAAEELSK